MRSACAALKDLSADERTRLEAEMREKAWRDEMDRLDGAVAKGREEGRVEGGRQERERNVRSMFADGIRPDQIARILRIDADEVGKILNVQ